MGRVKWFRSKDLVLALHGIADALVAVLKFIGQYIGNNHKKKPKGGVSSRKKPVKK